MGRELKLTLERKSGQIHDFSAVVAGRLVMAGDGRRARTATVEVPDAPVHLRLVVVGVPGSEYSVIVNLPGGAHDFTSTLADSVQRLEFDV